MKIIIFGDVHGNLVALEKLFDREKSEVDLFICHGDVVNYGPWSNEVVAFLNTIDNIKVLKGNHENYFLSGFYDGKNLIATTFFDYCYNKFDNSLKPIIERYGTSIEIPNYKVQHTIGTNYIFADTDISKIEITSNYIIGHSHQQFERTKEDYQILNTGSLGQNREFIDKSCYIIIDTDKNTYELKSFSHDIDVVINQMKSEKYPQLCIDYYLSKKRFYK